MATNELSSLLLMSKVRLAVRDIGGDSLERMSPLEAQRDNACAATVRARMLNSR